MGLERIWERSSNLALYCEPTGKETVIISEQGRKAYPWMAFDETGFISSA